MGFLSKLPVVKGETDLRYLNLTQIPENACHDETVLDLSHNKLTMLVKHVFILLTNLKTLNLKHNRIGIIEPGGFAGLSTLQTLDLSINKLEKYQTSRQFLRFRPSK